MTASPVTPATPLTSVGDNPGLRLVSALRDYSDVFLRCRGVQHRWDVTNDLHIAETIEGGELVERHFTCENCETVRRDRFLLRMDRWQVQRLEVLGAQYSYPEGYLMHEMGIADHPREVLRSEMFRRATTNKRRKKQ